MGLLRSLLKGSADALFIAESSTGMIVYANDVACQLVGYSREELIGKNQASLHPPEELEFIIAKFKEFTTTEGYKEVNAHVLHQNGNRVPVKISSSNNFEEDGKMYAAAFFKDITSEQSLEKIAYIQSHIVRDPIVNILGLLEVFDIQNFEGTEEQKTILLTIQHLTLDLDNIVKDIVKKTYQEQ